MCQYVVIMNVALCEGPRLSKGMCKRNYLSSNVGELFQCFYWAIWSEKHLCNLTIHSSFVLFQELCGELLQISSVMGKYYVIKMGKSLEDYLFSWISYKSENAYKGFINKGKYYVIIPSQLWRKICLILNSIAFSKPSLWVTSITLQLLSFYIYLDIHVSIYIISDFLKWRPTKCQELTKH